MLLGFLVLLLVLSEAFLVSFLIAIGRDKLVTRVGVKFQQFEMPVLRDRITYAAPGSGKVKDEFASESRGINWRKRNLARGGPVLWPGRRVPADLKQQRARGKF
jgi:hypothetical protein